MSNNEIFEAPVKDRVDQLDWQQIDCDLENKGFAIVGSLLTKAERDSFIAGYDQGDLYRKHIRMERHGYGRGEYKYFSYPLPPIVASLRSSLYEHLVPTANRWMQRMKSEVRYPEDHAAFAHRCHEAGQLRPTPLILKYAEGDYNRLHQDLYGEHVFPLQVAILLSDPEEDFSGGEFVITEQRPRMQSRPHVVPLKAGDAIVFAVNERPVEGSRGFYRTKMRHGVSELRSGRRNTVGDHIPRRPIVWVF